LAAFFFFAIKDLTSSVLRDELPPVPRYFFFFLAAFFLAMASSPPFVRDRRAQ
jgi:hypothetical protein